MHVHQPQSQVCKPGESLALRKVQHPHNGRTSVNRFPLTKQEISPDPKKIQALKHMEFPPDKETMRSFLGMNNYLNRYSALGAHLAAPLSSLTHQATDYKPGKTHMENFQRLKMEISNIKALPYFDTSAETTLQTDASKKGLGACLIQNGKVVCYASRALTKTEQNYQNLEREALGTIWGMEKSTISCMVRNLHWKQIKSHL